MNATFWFTIPCNTIREVNHMVPMEDCPYPFTEVAERFPVSRGARHAALVTRIREHGFRPPILVWEGEIIFGKEFLQAYAEAGVEPVFKTLPDDEEPLPSFFAAAIPALDLDNNQRAVLAYLVSQWSKRGRPRADEEKSATLRNLTQEDAAQVFGAKIRHVTYAAQVLSEDSPAVPELREAVLEWRIGAIDAARVVTRPPEVQKQAVALVMSKRARTVRRAVEQVEREIAEAQKEAAMAEILARPLDEAVDLRVANPVDLLRALHANTVDAIITNPRQLMNQMYIYSDLADLAAHVLKADGFLAVVGSSLLLPQTLQHLEHGELRWIMQANIHMGGPPINSGGPHHLALHQRPLLIYGMVDFRPPAGWSDLIEVPQPEDDPSGLDRDELMMRRIVERLCRPGGMICDPVMLDRAGAALAARRQGCTFVGATEQEISLKRIRRRVAEVGMDSSPEGGGALETGGILE